MRQKNSQLHNALSPSSCGEQHGKRGFGRKFNRMVGGGVRGGEGEGLGHYDKTPHYGGRERNS